jgi:hypothetical protein
MLNEPITFRCCFAAVKRRLGAITLMGLLSILMLVAAYIVVSIVIFILILLVGLVVGVVAAAKLPQWVVTTALVFLVILVVAASLLLILMVVSRVVFLPQIVMIEGQSAGNALGRAIRLGQGNWHRVGAIALFTYFVSISLLAAFAVPVLIGLYFWGMLTPEFFVGPVWSILYTSFGQISNLLSLPIWIVSFTLLYFDSRVRKEAYDIDLIAREINPGFIWQPALQPSAFGYQMPRRFDSEREYLQTGPLGLAGYRPPSRTVAADPPEAEARTEFNILHDKFQNAAMNPSATRIDISSEGTSEAVCGACGASLLPDASFCMTCGRVTR